MQEQHTLRTLTPAPSSSPNMSLPSFSSKQNPQPVSDACNNNSNIIDIDMETSNLHLKAQINNKNPIYFIEWTPIF